jgi:hypothetical protein
MRRSHAHLPGAIPLLIRDELGGQHLGDLLGAGTKLVVVRALGIFLRRRSGSESVDFCVSEPPTR